MKKVVAIMVDLSVVPKDDWEVKCSPAGSTYYELSYNLEIAVQSALQFSLAVDGKKYGSITTAYE